MADDIAPVRAIIERELGRQGLFHHMGCVIAEVAFGGVSLELPYRQEVAQQNGYFHGGAIGFLVDNATAAAAGTKLREGQSLLTAEYKISFLAPAVGEKLVCRAEVLKAGAALSVVEARCFAVQDGQPKLCAVALASMAVVAARP
ncbi:MAG: PaaI family thioesterase [Hyphomonadaceae bacterium]